MLIRFYCSFWFVVGKAFSLVTSNLREHGSGNTGTTNTFLQILGTKAGRICLCGYDFSRNMAVFVPDFIFGLQGLLNGLWSSRRPLASTFPIFASCKGGERQESWLQCWGSREILSRFPHPLSHLFLCWPLFSQHDFFSSVTRGCDTASLGCSSSR